MSAIAALLSPVSVTHTPSRLVICGRNVGGVEDIPPLPDCYDRWMVKKKLKDSLGLDIELPPLASINIYADTRLRKAENNRRYKERHPDRVKAADKAFREKSKKQKKAYDQARYERNKHVSST